MANGLLGKQVSIAGVYVSIYTVPANISYTLANVCILNRGGANTTVSVAISFSDTPELTDFIEADTVIPTKGTLERTFLTMSPGEKIIVKGDTSSLSIRVYGLEQNIATQTTG